MTSADYIVLAILAISALFAFFRGFMREILSIGAWILAGVATYIGLPLAQPFAQQYLKVPLFAGIAAGVAIFIVFLVLGSIISHFLSRNVRDSMFGPLDRSLGLLFGLLRGALVVCLLFLFLDWFNAPEKRPPWVANAKSLPYVVAGASMLKAVLPLSATEAVDDAAEKAKEEGQRAIDIGEAVGVLLVPDTEPAAGKAANEDDPGYKDAERGELDRLLQTQ